MFLGLVLPVVVLIVGAIVVQGLAGVSRFTKDPTFDLSFSPDDSTAILTVINVAARTQAQRVQVFRYPGGPSEPPIAKYALRPQGSGLVPVTVPLDQPLRLDPQELATYSLPWPLSGEALYITFVADGAEVTEVYPLPK